MPNTQINPKPIKICQGCGKIWETLDDFLKLEDLIPIGFQAHFLDGDKSILLFHHDRPNCGTTLAIPVTEFAHLIPDFYRWQVEVGTEQCEGHCLTTTDLEPCGHPYCRNALVRDFIQSLLRKKGLAELSFKRDDQNSGT